MVTEREMQLFGGEDVANDLGPSEIQHVLLRLILSWNFIEVKHGKSRNGEKAIVM